MNRHDRLCPAACECGACAPICECALITRTRAEERSTDTRDLTIAALRDQVAALQNEVIRQEHLLDQIRRLPSPGMPPERPRTARGATEKANPYTDANPATQTGHDAVPAVYNKPRETG